MYSLHVVSYRNVVNEGRVNKIKLKRLEYVIGIVGEIAGCSSELSRFVFLLERN